MKVLFRVLSTALLVAATVVVAYGGKGYFDARKESEILIPKAERLIADGRGLEGLGNLRSAWLIEVEDPNYWSHGGVDFQSPGAGMTTITQSLAKRLAFDEFKPGIAKLRQTTYALGLESRLTKQQIMALYLETLEMGRGPNNIWITGFYTASNAMYGLPPSRISDDQFIHLLSVLIAPSQLSLMDSRHPETLDRIEKIKRLLAESCEPTDLRDVWLEGCT